MPNQIKRIAFIATLFLIIGTMFASSYGKISGVVSDEDTRETLAAANVLLFDTDGNRLSGGATDIDGFYFINQVKPGVYQLRCSYMGYADVIVNDVRVSTDRTTEVNIEMSASVDTEKPIVIVAKREPIEKDITTTTQYTTGEEMEKMPVSSVEAVLAQKVGVVSHDGQLHYRGGRANEVAHYVDGMPVKDQAYGGQALSVSTNAVQEVSVQTGTFQAEYGGAMSAIVNYVTKEGNTNKTTGSVTLSTDDFGFEALNKYSTNTKQLQFSISGPEPISTHLLPMIGIELPRDKRISYFFSINGQNSDTWLKYNYMYDFDEKMYSQDEITTPYKIDYGWYGLFPEARQNVYQMTFKLKQNITSSMKFTLSYAGNIQRQHLWSWEYLYTPISSHVYEAYAHQANITFTHTLSTKTFYEIKSGLFFTHTEYSPNNFDPDDFAVDSVSYWNTLDDWYDVNNDGIPQVRQEWLDQNNNGMYDYGEIFWPAIADADTIIDGTGAIVRIDTIYIDSLPPQLGEEPWYDLNDNGIFEPKRTNYNTSYYGSPMDVGEPFMDGEPFRDGYSRMMVDGQLVQIDFDDPSFHDDTMWVDIDGDGMKDYGEWVFGTYYSNTQIALEETTWHDVNGDGQPDEGEYRDINMDGRYTTRDAATSGFKFPQFTDLNGNGQYDVGEPGEPFLDMNGNGYWDSPNIYRDDDEPYIDLNGNQQWDGPDGFMDRGMNRWATWSRRNTTTWVTKADLTSQVNKNNQVKTGMQFEFINIEMNDIQYPEGYYDGLADNGPYPAQGIFRSFYERSPKQLAFYVQDKMEYGGFIANVGVRAEIFIQAKEVLVDSTEADITRIINNEIGYEIIPSRSKISPRLGMSYPITDKAKLFFSYGHFYQLPAYNNFYQMPNQGSSAIMLIGNPELDFEKTVQYEIGVAYALNKYMTVQFAGYYKDIFNHINTTTAKIGPLTYSLYENVDYGRGRGLEFTYEKGFNDDFWRLTANYQFAYAYGKSSSDRSGYDARVDQTAIPLRDLPLDWDQRHHVTLNLDLSAQKGEHPEVLGWKLPDAWSMNFLFNWGSGFPYTPSAENPDWEVQPGEKAWERTNALRKPDRYTLDFRFIKNFKLFNLDYIAYIDVKNVTNRRNIDDVYADTGLPDDPISTDGLGNGMDIYKDPTRWSTPRAIQVGLKMNW